MRHPLGRRPAPLLPCLVAVLALLLGACGGGDDEEGANGGGESPATTAGPPRLAPLTGLPLEDPAVADRPAVTIKVDNGPEGRPQSGLDKADVIIEEKVEGGITRLLSVFHSQEADTVGPVRSVRSTDVALVAPIGGVFAYAGGIPPFEAAIKQAPVVVISENGQAQAFKYRADRRRPFKTYASTAQLRSIVGDKAKAPGRLFEFLGPGEPFAPPGATPAVHATAVFGPRSRSGWDFDAASGQWRHTANGTPHNVEGGGQLAFTNVVIQPTPYRATPYRDTSGSQVDEAVVVGSGDAVILSQGKQVRVRWSKTAPGAPTTYALADGTPVKLPPGRTWVALPPPGTPIDVR